MKRIVKYIAKDGTEFDSLEECSEFDRRAKFSGALTKFITEKFADVKDTELASLDRLWEIIYKDPSSFLAVVESAQLPPKRGRPRKVRTEIVLPEKISENTVAEITTDITPVVTKTKPVAVPLHNMLKGPHWRGYVGSTIPRKT